MVSFTSFTASLVLALSIFGVDAFDMSANNNVSADIDPRVHHMLTTAIILGRCVCRVA